MDPLLQIEWEKQKCQYFLYFRKWVLFLIVFCCEKKLKYRLNENCKVKDAILIHCTITPVNQTIKTALPGSNLQKCESRFLRDLLHPLEIRSYDNSRSPETRSCHNSIHNSSRKPDFLKIFRIDKFQTKRKNLHKQGFLI